MKVWNSISFFCENVTSYSWPVLAADFKLVSFIVFRYIK